MSCEIKTAGGHTTFTCRLGAGPRKCAYCDRPSTKLCDFVSGHDSYAVMEQRQAIVKIARTCDKPLCGQCAVSVGIDKDHCRVHGARGDREAQP